ncbi:zinc finger protein ush [Condylostylus longicornis]|uniref:zinc finger protein ush n=1 Tax=Condylostylus longicornis TaxID=2530218 RepID=UPI00244E43A8|nr:zinc finger protein ush [Condylostylus longicornis]
MTEECLNDINDNKDNNETVKETSNTEIDLLLPKEESISPSPPSPPPNPIPPDDEDKEFSTEKSVIEKQNDNISNPSEVNKKPSTTPSAVPSVRLNQSLASDPALKPNAKDLKYIYDEATKNEETNLESISENSDVNFNALSTTPNISQRVKVFMCIPCGIGFSSLSTLEAHQSYYCSHRQEFDEDSSPAIGIDSNSIGEPVGKSVKTGKLYTCSQCSYSADKKVSLNRHMRIHQASPAASSNASNGDDNSSQQIGRYCSDCDIKFSNAKTYRAHKQHYCNSRRSEELAALRIDSQSRPQSTSPQSKSKSPDAINNHQPILALPTNPIVLIPYGLIGGANIISSPLTSLSADAAKLDACYMLENGSLKVIAKALPNRHLLSNLLTNSNPAQRVNTPLDIVDPVIKDDVLKKLKKDFANKDTIPLDLSVGKTPLKRPSTDLILNETLEGKENLSNNSGTSTPEQLICAPSLPSSPCSSPKRRILSPKSDIFSTSPILNSLEYLGSKRASDVAFKLAELNVVPNNTLKQNIKYLVEKSNSTRRSELSATNPNANIPSGASTSSAASIVSAAASPQIYVKQGASKCKECNIVFCKYENYLAHKQHYCSARNHEEITEQQQKMNTQFSSSANSLNSSQTVAPTNVAYQQLICAACGIKYTSLDNLRAHQSYYCPKAKEPAPVNVAPAASQHGNLEAERCEKCNEIHEFPGKCSEIITSQNVFKCPVCGILSANAAENRKHLEGHNSVKAFRCSVCRYKGNTLRGMRTHIRMHFEKKSADFSEERFMSCILEEDVNETEINTNSEDVEQNSNQIQCDLCSYSSPYKGNVIRHIKIAHSQSETTPSEPSSDFQTDFEVKDDIPKVEPIEDINVSDQPSKIDGNMSGTAAAANSISDDSITPLVLSDSPPEILDDNNLDKHANEKYCEACDIRFNYMKTYIAHKRFYCKSQQKENSSIQNFPLIGKNKENVETKS